jgi:hypothetical protein
MQIRAQFEANGLPMLPDLLKGISDTWLTEHLLDVKVILSSVMHL